MSDVVLVYVKTGMDVGSTVAPPHNLLCVAAPLDKIGLKVKIIDQRVDADWESQLKKEVNEQPVYVGISSMTGTQIKYAMECARKIREWNELVPIVWGGVHPSLLPEQVLETGLADYVVCGEVDDTIVQITRDIADGKAGKIIRSPLADMEKLLPEPYHLINIEKYIHPDVYVKNSPRTLDVGQTSRGCPMKCGFCSSASLRERKWRPMSAGKAIDMIKTNVQKYKLTGIWLRDDEFYINHHRAVKIAEEIGDLGIRWYTSGTRVDVFNRTPDDYIDVYKKSGAHTLKFGAESGSNRILKLMNKGITREETIEANLKVKKHGIIPAYALMCGFPSETFKEMEDTISLARQLRKDNPQAQFETMAVYTALPATPMWDMAVEYGLKAPQKLEDWATWNFDEYDDEGRRISWFNSRDREAVGNLCYLSMLSNAVPNVIDSLENKSTRMFLKSVYALPHKYFQWRFFGAHYRYSGELKLVRALRNVLFYSGHKIFR